MCWGSFNPFGHCRNRDKWFFTLSVHKMQVPWLYQVDHKGFLFLSKYKEILFVYRQAFNVVPRMVVKSYNVLPTPLLKDRKEFEKELVEEWLVYSLRY